MIYIRTFAYNAEKTIERAIESILNQTVKEFRFFILDNGSTDRTGDIIDRYAKRDDRIVAFFSKVNMDLDKNTEFWELALNISDEDFFVSLDADDYYDETFLEEMLTFMEENHLEVAACGTEFVEDETQKKLGERLVVQSLILNSKETWDKYYPYVYWNLRQVWGKVYNGRSARARYEAKYIPDWWPKAYGGDTVNVFTSLKDATSFGVYNKILHHYTISKKSVSHKWVDGREKSDVTLFEKGCEFIGDKVGSISLRNLYFLFTVYLNALIDTLKVLGNAELEFHAKLQVMSEIFTHPITQKALSIDLSSITGRNESQRNVMNYKKAFLVWMIKFASYIEERDMVYVEGFLCSFNDLFKSLFKRESLYALLKCRPVIAQHIAFLEYDEALKELDSLIESNPTEETILLAQNISAVAEDESHYVFYSKIFIQWLLERGERERAKEELEEWLSIAPNDADFIEIRNRL